MYPAYGHYAPYAPTAPAFINSLQVGRSEQMLSVTVVFLFIYKVGGSWGVAEVKTGFIYQASFQQFVRKINKTGGETVKCLCVCNLVIRIKLVI